jgi:transposase
MTMQITAKIAQQMVEVLEEIKEEFPDEEKARYPFTEWEQKRRRVKERLRELPRYVERAADMITFEEKGPGRPRKLELGQRTMLFLVARLMNKSNRDVEDLLELFEPLFGFKVSYKSIERLYSDEEVKLVLHNLFLLLLRDEGVSGDFAGDGTGYSLSIEKHYRSKPKKKGKDYDYVFRVIDIQTGMYVGYGYSKKSEMEAFNRAMGMLEKLGVKVDSISLDRYYSSRKVLKMFDKNVAVYVIPKKNIAKLGFEWFRVIRRIMENPRGFLKRYFMRNLSEAGFSADKRRFGWRIRQRREDRQEMAMLSIALLHNIFTVRVKPQ